MIRIGGFLPALFCLACGPLQAQGLWRPGGVDARAPARPTPAIAAALFGLSGRVLLQRQDDTVPRRAVSDASGPVGHVVSSWEVTRSVAYSGRPLDMLVAADGKGRINPNECILCLRCQVVMNDPNACPVLKRIGRQAGAKP